MVLGHEGVGVVAKIGNDATQFQLGDRVGWGYIHDACYSCKYCTRGEYGHCAYMNHRYGVTELDRGSFSTYSAWKEKFLVKIPDGYPLDAVAPLMCAGNTVYNPFGRYNIKPTERVGVVGIGGLGHLTIQFAAAWGCDVVVFSSTDSKKDEALKLGATEFVATKGKDKYNVSKPIDHLLITTSSFPKWEPLIDVMADFGTIYPMTVDSGNINIPFMPLLSKEVTIQPSGLPSRNMFLDMLEFAARHGIRPIMEKYPLTQDGVAAAYEALKTGKVRYRAVFDI